MTGLSRGKPLNLTDVGIHRLCLSSSLLFSLKDGLVFIHSCHSLQRSIALPHPLRLLLLGGVPNRPCLSLCLPVSACLCLSLCLSVSVSLPVCVCLSACLNEMPK